MGVITDNLDLWGPAIWGTVLLFLGGGILALVIGFIVGAMRVSPVPIARAVGTVYVNLVRNTPLTLVCFFFVLGVAQLIPQRVDATLLGIAALGIYTATYVAEVLRSGINTVPVGQAEAARALGLTFGQVMTLVVVPQAGRAVIPPMMSVLIALLKNTTVLAGFNAFLNLGSIRASLSERSENALVVLLWVAVIFVVLVLLLAWWQRALESKWRIAR